MPHLEQLHFQRLPPEAQRATVWRLAWGGMAPEQIATRIGWSAERVRQAMHDELPPARPRWQSGGLQTTANA
jgi:DNA-directed RNA polymerase specialized sigma24 family protein